MRVSVGLFCAKRYKWYVVAHLIPIGFEPKTIVRLQLELSVPPFAPPKYERKKPEDPDPEMAQRASRSVS